MQGSLVVPFEVPKKGSRLHFKVSKLSPSLCEDWFGSPEEVSEMSGTMHRPYLSADVQTVSHKQNSLRLVRHSRSCRR